IAVRTGFYVLVGLPDSTSVLVDLPGVDLPNWFTNITLLGPIHVGGLVQALIEGLRLGGLIVVFGAANALANPRRALRHLPGSLHHLGTAAVIAVSAVPQLLSSIARVRRVVLAESGAGRCAGCFAGFAPFPPCSFPCSPARSTKPSRSPVRWILAVTPVLTAVTGWSGCCSSSRCSPPRAGPTVSSMPPRPPGSARAY